MPRSISTAGTGAGGSDFPNGTVDTYNLLPDYSLRLGQVWYVKGPSIFALNTRGYYVAEPAGWVKTTIKVQVSEDAGSFINWTDWNAFISFSQGVNSGDQVRFNGITYNNLTGTYTPIDPSIDNTNWGIYTDYNSITNPNYTEGRLFYDSHKHALSYYNDITDVTVNMGQEIIVSVCNTTGADILNGTVVTGIGGFDGDILITLANAQDKEKSRFIGMTTHDIPNGTCGYVTRFGEVGGLDTSMYTLGQPVYLSVIPGELAVSPPIDGGYAILVGMVKNVSATEGSIIIDPSISELTVEVTDTNGFPPDQKSNTTLSVNEVTRTFTIAPVSGAFHFYELGAKYEKGIACNVVWDDIEGEVWFFFEAGELVAENAPNDDRKQHIILNHAFVSTIYWNATDKKLEIGILDERHGISMSPKTHLYLHLTRGAQYISGLGLGNFVIGTGTANSNAQFSVASGMFFDEDITHMPEAIAVGTAIPVVYNLGALAYIRTNTQTGYAVLNAPAGRLYYNQNNGGVWQLTEVPDNRFVLYHIIAINGLTTKTISIMGQNAYSKIGDARSGAFTEIGAIIANLPFAEFVSLGTVIFQTKSSYTNATKSKIVLTESGANYVDWRVTELAQGSNPTSHNNLTDLQLSGLGVTWGHVSDVAPMVVASLTTTERDALLAVNGMIMYNTTTNQFNFRENGVWVTK